MKKQSWTVITLGLILSISAVLVQAGSVNASKITLFEVNFDFQIGNTKFPKGKYRLSERTQTVLYLENLSNGRIKVLLGSPASRNSSNKDERRLTFNRYGDTYFLREAVSSSITGRLKLSKAEKEVRKNSRQRAAKVRVKYLRNKK